MGESAAESDALRDVPTTRELFLAFLKIGISAFGGALPWVQRVVVEDRKWMSQQELTDVLTVCQAVPGPNVVNTAVFIGMQFRGIRGAIATFLGLLAAPFCIVLALSQLYHSVAHLPLAVSTMKGMSIAATAYLFFMSLKLAKPFYKNVWGVLLCAMAIGLSAFLHLHMAFVLLIGGVIGGVLAHKKKL